MGLGLAIKAFFASFKNDGTADRVAAALDGSATANVSASALEPPKERVENGVGVLDLLKRLDVDGGLSAAHVEFTERSNTVLYLSDKRSLKLIFVKSLEGKLAVFT